MSIEICARKAKNILLAKKPIILLVETQGLPHKKEKKSMKKLMPILIAMLLLLAGCVEYDEELWLNSNGTGRAKLRLSIESHFSNTQEFLRVFSSPGIHLREYNLKSVGANKKIYYVDFSFDSIDAFNNLDDQLSALNFFGQINILPKDSDGNIVVKRKISIEDREIMDQLDDTMNFGEDVDMSEEEYIASLDDDDDILKSIMADQEKNYTWTYKLHVPWKIIHAGDNFDSITPDRKTVTWKFNFKDLENRTELMVVEMKKGLSWMVYVLLALGGGLLLFFVIWMVRIGQRSHLKDAIKHSEEKEKELE